MRTTVTIDEDVYEAAMKLSRMSGDRLGKALSDLARRALSPQPSVRIVKYGRFPHFEVPPESRKISAEEVQKILDEEGTS
jgi:hypothetical protein